MIRNPLVHFIAACVLLVAVASAYGFWYSTVQAKSAQIATLSSEIQDKTQDTTRIAVAKTQLVTLDADEGTVQQYFVSTNDVVPFLEQLAATGKYLGSDVQVVSVSANPGTPFGQLSLSLKLSGSFNSVLRTIGAIEYGPYGTTLSSLTFSAPGPSTASTTQTWSAAMVISVGTEASVVDQTAGATPATTPETLPPATSTTPATAAPPSGSSTPSVTP